MLSQERSETGRQSDSEVMGAGRRPEYILPVRGKWKVLQRSGYIVE